MSADSLEHRLSMLEAEVARLKAKVDGKKRNSDDWLDKIYGSFANDPIYEEAMRLGREWRESFRPKKRRQRKRAQ